MSEDADKLDAHLDAATALLELRVAPEWRGSILSHLDATMKAARFVSEFPLDDEVEPAPVFAPAAREDAL
ncbi:DUF4089 domain-containing protein [Chelatococcus sambhunathii]|uniref:DUF4089 domain-containing protein n=1 Tax=Chelatococcus sambhunathii TaxID=363953 RepID=A0ABU1DD38_9HYPH|nr:DUF4089 domain-containing protein [Chelatococcus sambhunathii]MDR4306027.1 DUF4089 domain-containing protein [Chelatococcus sambhunathii]